MRTELQTTQPALTSDVIDVADDVAIVPAACVNCGERLSGDYCHACGEKRVEHGALSLKRFAGDAFQQLIDLEHSKIFKTLKSLLFKPGFLTNEYVAGRRMAYLSPLKLCLIIFGISLFLYTVYRPVAVYDVRTMIESDQTGTWEKAFKTLAAEKQSALDEFIARVNEKWQNYVSLFQITNVVFLAILLQVVYFFTKRFFVEHLVFALHFLSFTFLLTVILWPLYTMVGVKLTAASATVSIIVTAISIVYLFFALRAVYRQPLALTLLKTLVVYAGSYLILVSLMIGTLLLALAHVMLSK